MPPLTEPLVLSISGRDRPGLLAEIASALAAAEIAVIDIEQATLQNVLALSFLLDLEGDPGRSRRLLQEVIPKATALGLSVDVRSLEPDQVRLLKETDQIVVTLVSERPSTRIVAEIATVTARHGANVVSIRRIAEEDLRAGEYVIDVTRVERLDRLKAEILSTAESLGVDVGISREDVYRKSKRVVVFDMDSTLIAAEVIDLLAEKAGTSAEVARLTRDAMEGGMDFSRALRERVELLKGLPESALDEVLRSVSLTPGAEETILVLKRLGYRTGVLSGGFTFVADAFKERLGLDYAFANRLEIEAGRLTGRVLGPILDGQAKAVRLEEIARQERVPLDQVVGVGDGANDIPMLQKAGLGIAFRAKEATRRSADGSIQRNDFLGLLYLLGVTGRDVRLARRAVGDVPG